MDVAGDLRNYHTIFSHGLTLVGWVLGHWQLHAIRAA